MRSVRVHYIHCTPNIQLLDRLCNQVKVAKLAASDDHPFPELAALRVVSGSLFSGNEKVSKQSEFF
jgi:hypothetical protein